MSKKSEPLPKKSKASKKTADKKTTPKKAAPKKAPANKSASKAKSPVSKSVRSVENSDKPVSNSAKSADGVNYSFNGIVAKFVGLIDSINNWMSPPVDGDENLSPDAVTRKPVLLGGWMIIFVFGFLGLWSALAPLASAAIAPGKIILSGSKKTIQHLEGGVIDEILVREGQNVTAGQVLIRLNETAARAKLDLFRKQRHTALAAEARLIAERDGLDKIPFPKSLIDGSEKTESLKEVLLSQQRLFDSRRANIDGQKGLLEQKKAQYQEEISGLKAQISSASEQISLLNEEIGAVKKLLAQGNAQKPRLLALQRQQSSLKGNRGEFKARISKAEQAIAEADIGILNLYNELNSRVASEMREVVDKLADLQERLKASNDVINRIEITAPLSGVITDLKAHTIGGVIRSGEPIMDIVPIDELLVEARVQPQDIDVVRTNLPARVMLSAYAIRHVPPVPGIVVSVSADRFEDNSTGMSYYKTRIKLDEDELAEYEDIIELTPGMPAEAIIVTGERSVLSYLMMPITSSFRKAFREE